MTTKADLDKVTLDDKYTVERGRVFLTGTQALFRLLMLQRVRDAYRGLGSAERAAVDRALAGIGFEALFAYEPRHRVARRPFKIALEPAR